VTRVARRRLSARIRSIVRSSQFLESLGATAVAGEFDPLTEFHDLDCANTHWTATLRTGQHPPSPVTATFKPPWGPPSDQARKPQRRGSRDSGSHGWAIAKDFGDFRYGGGAC